MSTPRLMAQRLITKRQVARRLITSRLVATCLIATCIVTTIACGPARADIAADADALRSGLSEMLSMLSFGSVSVADQPPQVTQSGSEFHVQLPLNGFVAPPGASVAVVAHPSADGIRDVTSLTFLAAGALGSSIDQVLSYTIARQAMHGRIDPRLTTPSTFAADLGVITLQTATGARDTEQTIEHVTVDGTLHGAAAGRVDLQARDSAANWHLNVRDPAGLESVTQVQRLSGHVSLTDLDRAQGLRLLAAARSLTGTPKPSPRQPDLSPAARGSLTAMLDAAEGLLSRFTADETFEGLKFRVGSGTTASAGTLGRLKISMTGDTEDQQLRATADFALDDLSLTSLSADTAAFLPHHVAARSVLTGLPVASVRALLRAATAADADSVSLQRQVTDLLKTPNARAAIESVAFDAGPLHVRSAARFVPRASGDVGADIHISATGIDALLTQLQGNPNAQGILPMAFLAKGMGRAQGDAIVWDISLGGGPLTINGTAFGAPGAQPR